MGLAFISFIQNHWPFARKLDDLQLSDRLVSRLSLPDHTKHFVYALVEPETNTVVYILAAQNLSKQSAVDAELLIREVRPDAVVTQVGPSSLEEIKVEEEIGKRSGGGGSEVGRPVPTSILGVLKGCFVDKINKERYESIAGSFVLKEIFGVGFYGHFFAAAKAAKEVGCSVFFIESPFVSSCDDFTDEPNEKAKKFQGLGSNSSSLVPQNVGVRGLPKGFSYARDLCSETATSLGSALSQFNQKLGRSDSVNVADAEAEPGKCHPIQDYQVPSFAQSVYPLLVDLHGVFGNLPLIQLAMTHAQKMFNSVDKGETVDAQLLSEVQTFQIAVEGLRVGLNSAGRYPINKDESSTSSKTGFSDLPAEDKSQALFAQAIRSQTHHFKSIVAIVDASSLAGIRKHWETSVPPDVKNLIEQLITKYEGEEETSDAQYSEKKRLISDKPVVAVGAGATVALGASSLSKAVPISTFMKLATYKVPASLKFALVQTHKAMSISFSKALGMSKVVGPRFMYSEAVSVTKAAASAKNINAITHSLRAYAQRTSFSATRTAFYEIMRKRSFQPVGYKPWLKFGCCVSACSGLLFYGNGIECVVESIPVAPAIASLGRGLQKLHQANQVVSQPDSSKMQEAIQSFLYRFKQ